MDNCRDCLILDIGSTQVRVWRRDEASLVSHIAPTPGAVSAQLCAPRAAHDFEPVAQLLRTALASTIVSSSAILVVLLTNPDTSPHFWFRVQAWLTQQAFVPPAHIRLMSCALFMAHLYAMTTGIVIDIAHHATRVTPVCDGFVVGSAVNLTVGMGTVASVDRKTLDMHLTTQLDASVRRESAASGAIDASVTAVLRLVDGIEEAIEKTVEAVRRAGVFACLSRVLLAGGGADCDALRETVCLCLQTLVPQASVAWD